MFPDLKLKNSISRLQKSQFDIGSLSIVVTQALLFENKGKKHISITPDSIFNLGKQKNEAKQRNVEFHSKLGNVYSILNVHIYVESK